MSKRGWLGTACVLGVVLASLLRAAPEQAKVPAKLAQARADAAKKTYELVWKNYTEGFYGSGEMVYRWSQRWLDADNAMNTGNAQRIAAFQAHLDRMRLLEKWARDNYKLRVSTLTAVRESEYFTAEAEIWLSEAKSK